MLQKWLRKRADELAPDDAAKVESHPLRVLDSKRPETRAVLADAPRMVDHLDAASVAHGERVQAGLKLLGIDFEVDETLVRGLDYYTHTLFEFQSSSLENAQSTILGGGRYDGLIEQLGGPPTPGMGFGSGIERVLLSCDAEGVFAAPGVEGRLLRRRHHRRRGRDGAVPGPPGRWRGDRPRLRRSEHEGPDEGRLQVRRPGRGRSSATTRRPAGTATIRDLTAGEQSTVDLEAAVDHIRKVLDT